MSSYARFPALTFVAVLFASTVVPGVGTERRHVSNGRTRPEAARESVSATVSGNAGCKIDEAAAVSPDIVVTDRGAIRGALAGSTHAFKGIPYAAPPTGNRRWRPPQRASCWSGVRPATSFGGQCPQLGGITGTTQTWFGVEDCLYLNIWTPSDRFVDESLPVVFFIHGGGNTRGASNFVTFGANIYDGQRLAESGRVIVVTANYRLHYLGWLAHVSLTAESADGTSGNYGARDLIQALTWVRRNIDRFGGDPKRVLVFGQSAGARNACVLATSPRARGLLSRVAMMSGGCEDIPTLARMEQNGEAYVENLGCAEASDIPACLRSKPLADVVLSAVREPLVPGGFQLGPNIDGSLLAEQPLDALRGPHHAHVPWLVSSTADEVANALLPGFWTAPVTTDFEYETAVRALFPDALEDDVLGSYPTGNYATPRTALIQVLTDSFLVCPARRLARVAASWEKPVWRAWYTHRYSNGPLASIGAGHITDMPFWFDNLALPGFTPSPQEVALGEAMASYLTHFATSGDPNSLDSVSWPPYDAATDTHLMLDDLITADAAVRTTLCDFWDAQPLSH